MPMDTSIPHNSNRTIIPLAALFEGEFSIDWLEDILEQRPSKILDALENSVREGVLTCKSPGVYIFNDNQYQNEYQGQLYKDEKELFHHKIAILFEKELPDTNTKAFAIARHLLNIKNDCWGCQWLFKSGMMHINDFQIDDAARCFNKVINDSVDLKGEEADLVFIKSAVEYSNISTARESIENILHQLQLAMEKAIKINNKIYQALIEMHIAKNKWLLNLDLNQALLDFERGLSKAEKIEAPELIASVTVFKTYFFFWQGLFGEVIDVYENSIPDIERYPLGQFPTMAAITVARSYAMIGELTQGLGMLDTIREHCLASNNLYMAARSASSIGSILLSIRRLDDAVQYLKLSLKEADQCKNHWVVLISTFMLALAYYYHGDKDRCLRHIREFLRHSRHSNVHQSIHADLLEIGWAVEEGKLPEISDLSFEKVLRPQLNLENVYIKGIAHRYQAFLFKRRDRPARDIMTSLERSIRFLQRSGNPIEIAKSQLELSRFYLEMGNEKLGNTYKDMASEVLEPINSDLIPDELRPFSTGHNAGEIFLEEMSRIGADVFSPYNDKRFLRNIIISANRTIGAERGAIFLIHQNDGKTDFQLRASKNVTPDQMRQPAFAAAMEMMKKVARSGKGHIMDMDSERGREASTSDSIRSRLCVPIGLKGKLLGVMYHDNRLLSDVFKQSHLQIISF